MNKNQFRDYGGMPLVLNLPSAAQRSSAFRQTLWTGKDLQLTVMSVPVGEEIGCEMHEDHDQMLRVEEGVALLRIGDCRENLKDARRVSAGMALLVPAGLYHNVINVGQVPLKISSVYGPPAHPRGTVHLTKADADAAEKRED